MFTFETEPSMQLCCSFRGASASRWCRALVSEASATTEEGRLLLGAKVW